MTRQQVTGHCDRCQESFRYYLIHNGFNDSVYAYCSLCTMTAELSLLSASFPPAIRATAECGLIPEELQQFLKPCLCGGEFTRDAIPRCPKCREGLSAVEATPWIEQNAPGFAKGWRWQRNWVGIYSMIIEDKILRDNLLSVH